MVYQWNVGVGWEYQGNPVSTFNTTTTTVQLMPYLFPPSDVKVTPVLDGESYPQLTSDVSLGYFNPFVEIVGDGFVCDVGIYTLNNSINGVSIQSASTSNNNATASVDASTGEITVAKVNDGLTTLIVTLQNSCGQTVDITKDLQIGIPASVNNATLNGATDICGSQNYTYTLIGANHPCIDNISWTVSDNLTIVSQNQTNITVTRNPFNNQYAGLISADIAGSTTAIEKGVWVGVPGNSGLAIQKLGSYDLYAGRWTSLRSRFIPISYEANEPLDISFDWQIPNSQVRTFTDTSRKDVNPNAAGQLNIGVRVICNCGNGAWRYQLFNVEDDGNGGGGGLIPAN